MDSLMRAGRIGIRNYQAIGSIVHRFGAYSQSLTSAMGSAGEQVFAPVAPLFALKTEAEAVAMATDTEYGLAS